MLHDLNRLAAGPVSVLSVTDIRTAIVIGPINQPCKQEAFSFTDLDVAVAGAKLDLGVSLGLFASEGSRVTILGNSISDNLSAGIGHGTDVIDFSGAPTSTLSPTPQPSSLCLMATGFAAAAVRRRITLTQAAASTSV